MYKNLSILRGAVLLSLFTSACHEKVTPKLLVIKPHQKIIKHAPKSNTQPDIDAVSLLKEKFPAYSHGKIEKLYDKKTNTLSISITSTDQTVATLVGANSGKKKNLKSHDVKYAFIPDNHGKITQEFSLSKQSDGFKVEKIQTHNEIEDDQHKAVSKARDYQSAIFNLKR
jgi:hypothetical protein